MSEVMRSMEAIAYGKWILAGEHAVLRGSPAVAFPVYEKSLKLRYVDEGGDRSPASVEFGGDHGSEISLLFWGVMERALQATGHSHSEVHGRFFVENSIPVGAGLGASAALCVIIGRWIAWNGWIGEKELPEFCRELENLFHGESSGVDIAIALSGRGLHYERSGTRFELEPRWRPEWYLSYSGKRGVTSQCIARVKALWQKDEALGRRIDDDMKDAVLMAEGALAQTSPETGFERLAEAINKARTCFERWGLAGGELGSHIQWLFESGAYAVKPTGSGDGGYVLSLWRKPPTPEVRQHLIALSR